MPRLSMIRALLRKEFLDLTRDKATLFVNYGIPLLLYPATLALFGEAMFMRFATEEARGHHIVVVGESFPRYEAEIKVQKAIALTKLTPEKEARLLSLVDRYRELGPFPKGVTRPDPHPPLRQFLKTNDLDAVIFVDKRGDNYDLAVFTDRLVSASLSTLDQINWLTDRLRTHLRDERLRARGITPEYVLPLRVHESNLGEAGNAVAQDFSGQALPYFLFLFLTLATYYPCLQTMTGEREKGTLTSLLSTSLTAWETLLAKFGIVLFSSVSSVLTHATSLVVLGSFLVGSHFQLPHFAHLPYLIVLVISAAALLAAGCLCAATLARQRNEGEGLLSVLLLCSITPAAFVPIADIHLTWTSTFVPMVNVAVIFRDAVVTSVSRSMLIGAILTNFLAAAAALSFAVQLFSREVILFRGEGSLVDLLALNRKAIREPSPALSGLLFFVMILPLGYAGISIAAKHPFIVLPAMQGILFLGLPIGLSRYFRFPLREIFSWRVPRVRSVVGALLVAGSMPFVIPALMSLLPVPEKMGEEFAKQMGISGGNEVSPILTLIIFSLVPGICEEVAYRGLILAGFLKRFSPTWSIILTGVLFGMNHFSIFRLPPTALMGFILSFAVWRTRSLPISMITHVCYNALLFIIATHPSHFPTKLSPLSFALGLLGTVTGLILFAPSREKQSPGDGLTIAEETPRRAAFR